MTNLPRIALPLLLPFLFITTTSADDSADLKPKLEQRIKDIQIRELTPSPIPGLYEMIYDLQVGYASADGHFVIINGQLIELDSGRNLTATRRTGLIQGALERVSEKNMIVFAPEKTLRTITVFTDVDCSYCARLHLEVPALNKAGVKVRYLLYPRAGVGSDTYKRMESVWCSKDRHKAIGVVKAGGSVVAKTCANPIKEHLELGKVLGVQGTPSLVLDDGRIIPGYAPAQALLNELGIKDEKNKQTKP